MLRFSERGFTAFLTGRWLDDAVVVREDPAAGRLLEGRFRGARHPVGTRATLWLGMKQLAGKGQCRITVDARDKLSIELDSPDTSLSFIGPRYFAGLTASQLTAVGDHPTEERMGSLGLEPAQPPWIFGVVSNRSADSLAGLDPDPLIAARGVADAILAFAGVVSDPVARYKQAAVELRSAVAAIQAGNEAALQRLLEEKPWVLIHESEYDDVRFRPRLQFEERLASGDVAQRRIEPDLVYDLPASESLVVEIESATKRLMLSTTETSYQKPAAASSGAVYQIGNYKQLHRLRQLPT